DDGRAPRPVVWSTRARETPVVAATTSLGGNPMKLGAPLMRGLIGGLFIGHGTQKLLGWFDGPGLEGTTGMMGKLGLRPPPRHALLAGAAETAGGTLVALGARTPLATTMLTSTMTTAIRKVHWSKGP